MTKGRILLVILVFLLLGALVAVVLWNPFGEQPAQKVDNTVATTVPTTEAPTTVATIAPTTEPPATKEAQQLYWVFAYGGLWVRSGPGTEYVLVGSLEDGDTIEVLEWKDGWAYIESPVKGWCSGAYLHELGWYYDVKTPEGRTVQDQSLKGKWVHVTTPEKVDGAWTCRAGVFRLRSDGTFIHRVDEYRQNGDGQWEISNTLEDHPYWVGEYTYDGKQLVLYYMAELEETYDRATGKPKERAWVTWTETVTLNVTKASDTLTISNPEDIVVTVANEHAVPTEATLYKASASVGTPEDVCAVLQQNYG